MVSEDPLVLFLGVDDTEAQAQIRKNEMQLAEFTKKAALRNNEFLDRQKKDEMQLAEFTKKAALRNNEFLDRQKKDEMLLDEFTRKEATVRQKFYKSAMGMMNTLRTLTYVFRSAMGYFGQTLDPVQDAIITSIYTSLTAIMAMHRALDAASVGTSGIITIGLSALAMGMSIAAIGTAQSGMADARAQTDKAMSLMIQLESLITTSQVWM